MALIRDRPPLDRAWTKLSGTPLVVPPPPAPPGRAGIAAPTLEGNNTFAPYAPH